MTTPPQDPYGSARPPHWDAPPAQGYGPPPGYGPPSGYGPPPLAGQAPGPQGGWSGGTQTETKAMVALGLAIAAYTPTIPFLGAIAALVLARMARRDILASGGRLTGLSLCTWAVALAWVHLVLVFLAALVFAALILLPFSFS